MRLHATATVFVLDQRGLGARLLFVRHTKGGLAGLWLPPGGHVETDERPDEAAVREVREETGLAVALIDLAPAGYPLQPGDGVERLPQPHHVQIEDIVALPGEPAHRHLDFIFVAAVQGPATDMVAETGRPARWMRADELDAWPLVPDARLWAQVILAELASI